MKTNLSDEKKIRVLFCDQLNLARGKYIPESFAQNGVAHLCKGVFAITYSRQLVDAHHAGLAEGLPDVSLHFNPDDYRESWEANTLIALADVYENDSPFPLCGRSALKAVIEKWEKHGLTPMIGIEGEAFVFKQIDNKLIPYDTPGSFVYGTGPFNDPDGLMDEIWNLAAKCNIPIESLNAEFDAPQFELTLKYTDALQACDDYFIFKNLARETLYKKGYLLSFLPKPLESLGGSGLHINISFRDKKGNNALAGGLGKGELSELAQGCIAGLLEHHEALGAILAPIENSYSRLKSGNMCGFWANWGHDHRAVAVRLSGGNGQGARIEHRVGDAASSPYFAVASILEAALLGFEKKYPLPAEETKDGFEEVSVTRRICETLSQSLDSLENDIELTHQLGSHLIQNYLDIKRAEVDELKGLSFNEIVSYYSHYI